jgi:hypothetical protein
MKLDAAQGHALVFFQLDEVGIGESACIDHGDCTLADHDKFSVGDDGGSILVDTHAQLMRVLSDGRQ